MKTDRFVSVIAPLFNDEGVVEDFIRETVPVLRENYTNYELVLIDDDSKDRTVERVSRLLNDIEGIRLIRLSREFGEEVAISAGLETVIGDYVVVMIPGCDPPEHIPEMVARAINGIDVVFGVRRDRSDESWLIRTGARLFYWYCRQLLKLDLPANSTQFRCLSRQAVNAITQIKDSYRYLRLFSSYVGYDRQRFEYDPLSRGRTGKSRQRGFIQRVNEAIALIIENSAHPLRFVSWLGLATAGVILIYVMYVFGVYFLKEDVLAGWTTLSLQNAGQFFLITLILTALCEYSGRILNRLQMRPLYYVREERNSAVLLLDAERRNIVEESRDIQINPYE